MNNRINPPIYRRLLKVGRLITGCGKEKGRIYTPGIYRSGCAFHSFLYRARFCFMRMACAERRNLFNHVFPFLLLYSLDYRKVLELDPQNIEAKLAVDRLPRQIEDIQTREKEELLSQLKSIGDKILGKFGLSTENFKLERNPDSGSYSINFQR